MASKRHKRRMANRSRPALTDKTGMSSEQLLAHRELAFIRSGISGSRTLVAKKARLLREARQINGLDKPLEI